MIVGHSLRGRAIEAIVVGSGETLALVHGGIHGDEPGAALAVSRLARVLDPSGPRIVVVAAVNPDGLAAHTKNNARDVDLNRNFAAHNFSVEHAPGYCPGAAPLSEPESAALAALIERERPRRLVAVHQPFACVNFDGPARPLAERMSEACGWPVVDDIGYPTPGSFGSRYGKDLGLAVITLELPRPLSPNDHAAAEAALLIACRLP